MENIKYSSLKGITDYSTWNFMQIVKMKNNQCWFTKMSENTIFIQLSHWLFQLCRLPTRGILHRKYSSKPFLHGFYKGSGLAWQSMHYLQLHATSFYEKLFAYNFSANGHFVIEICDHNLLQVSTNLFLGPRQCGLYPKCTRTSLFLTLVNCVSRQMTTKCGTCEHTDIHW